jgi:hypothetical protein
MVWIASTLPGCLGHACEVLHGNGGHCARVWQASQVTAGGAWCWKIDDRDVHVTRGNRGVAKTAARRALKLVTKSESARMIRTSRGALEGYF